MSHNYWTAGAEIEKRDMEIARLRLQIINYQLDGRDGTLAEKCERLERELAEARQQLGWPTDTERKLAEAQGLLDRLARRHEWTPYGGPCICEEHVAARAALTTPDQPTVRVK